MSASIDSFDANAYRARVAATLAVPVTAVQLKVQPGSLVVSVRIDAVETSEAARLLERISQASHVVFGAEAEVMEVPHLTQPLLDDALEREAWISNGTNVDPSIQAEFAPSPPTPRYPPAAPPSPSPPPIRPPYPVHVRAPISRVHRESQQAAMHAIWDGLGLSAPHLSEYPCDASAPKAWVPPLECDQGHVIGIRIHSHHLTGTLSEAFGTLSELQTLELTNNRLSGTVPSEFGALRQLRSLELDQNYLSGSLPTEFGMLSELRSLSTFWNRLSGTVPTEFRNLDLDECELGAGNIWSTNAFECPLPTQLSKACMNDLHCGPLHPMALQYRPDLAAQPVASSPLLHSPPSTSSSSTSPPSRPIERMPVPSPPTVHSPSLVSTLSPPPTTPTMTAPPPPHVAAQSVPPVVPSVPNAPDAPATELTQQSTAALETSNANVNTKDDNTSNVGTLTSLAGASLVVFGMGWFYIRRRRRAQKVRKELVHDQAAPLNAVDCSTTRRRVILDADACTEDNSSTPRDQRDHDVDEMLTPRSKAIYNAQSETPQPSDLRASLLDARRSLASEGTSRLPRTRSRCLNAELQRLSERAQEAHDVRNSNTIPSAEQHDADSHFGTLDDEVLGELNTSERHRLNAASIETFISNDDAAGVGVRYAGNASDGETLRNSSSSWSHRRARSGKSTQDDANHDDDESDDTGDKDDKDDKDDNGDDSTQSSDGETNARFAYRGGMTVQDVRIEPEESQSQYLGDLTSSEASVLNKTARQESNRRRKSSRRDSSKPFPSPTTLPRPSRESMSGVRHHGNSTILEEEEREFSSNSSPRSSNGSGRSNGTAASHGVLTEKSNAEERTSYLL